MSETIILYVFMYMTIFFIFAGIVLKKSWSEYFMLILYMISVNLLNMEIIWLIMDATDVIAYGDFYRPIYSQFLLLLIPLLWLVYRGIKKYKGYKNNKK